MLEEEVAKSKEALRAEKKKTSAMVATLSSSSIGVFVGFIYGDEGVVPADMCGTFLGTKLETSMPNTYRTFGQRGGGVGTKPTNESVECLSVPRFIEPWNRSVNNLDP